MNKRISTIADNNEVKGFVVSKTKVAITIRLDEPKPYSCTATCYVGEHSEEKVEDLLKALCLMIVCIEAILQHDERKRIHLKVSLHHATDRMLKMDECRAIAQRLIDNGVTPTYDAKLLYCVLTGEYRYWFSQRARIFSDYFKESIGRWEFCSIPPCISQLL